MEPLDGLLIGPRHAAARLGISPSRLSQLAREHRILALTDTNGRRLYLESTIQEFAAEREAKRSQLVRQK